MDQNTTLFSVIGVALLAIMIIGMLISQARHKALERKNTKLRMLDLQFKRLQNLLRSLPPNYLSSEMRDFLYQALLQNLTKQLELAADKNDLLKDDYRQIKEERELVKQHPPEAAEEALSGDQANIYRGLLKTLYQFIQRNYETGRMKKDHAEKMLKQVEFKLIDTAVEFFSINANNFWKADRHREARNAFQRAIDTIANSKQAAQFTSQQMKLNGKLESLNRDWKKYREQKSPIANTNSKLAEEMDSMEENAESWKMKQSYDGNS